MLIFFFFIFTSKGSFLILTAKGHTKTLFQLGFHHWWRNSGGLGIIFQEIFFFSDEHLMKSSWVLLSNVFLHWGLFTKVYIFICNYDCFRELLVMTFYKFLFFFCIQCLSKSNLGSYLGSFFLPIKKLWWNGFL